MGAVLLWVRPCSGVLDKEAAPVGQVCDEVDHNLNVEHDRDHQFNVEDFLVHQADADALMSHVAWRTSNVSATLRDTGYSRIFPRWCSSMPDSDGLVITHSPLQ